MSMLSFVCQAAWLVAPVRKIACAAFSTDMGGYCMAPQPCSVGVNQHLQISGLPLVHIMMCSFNLINCDHACAPPCPVVVHKALKHTSQQSRQSVGHMPG